MLVSKLFCDIPRDTPVVFPFKPDQVEEHELEEVTEGRLRWRVQDLEAKVKELEEKIDKLST